MPSLSEAEGDLEPIPHILLGFVGVTIFLLMFWQYNYFRFRHSSADRSIQTFLSYIIFGKFASSVFDTTLWTRCLDNEERVCPTWNVVAASGAWALYQMILYLFLFRASRGVNLTIHSLDERDSRTIGSSVLALGIAILGYKLWTPYFVFAVLLMYLLNLMGIFSGIAVNFKALHAQISRMVSRLDVTTLIVPYLQRELIFRRLQWIISMYVYASIAMYILVAFSNRLLMEVVLVETINMFLLLGLCFTFWRRENDAYILRDSDPELNLDEFDDLMDDTFLSLFGNGPAETAAAEDPPPYVHLVLVEHPASVLESGDVIANLSLAIEVENEAEKKAAVEDDNENEGDEVVSEGTSESEGSANSGEGSGGSLNDEEPRDFDDSGDVRIQTRALLAASRHS